MSNPTPEVVAAAKAAAERAYPPGTGRLGGKLFKGEPAKGGFRERDWYVKGYLAGWAAGKRTAVIEALEILATDLDAYTEENGDDNSTDGLVEARHFIREVVAGIKAEPVTA